jgi:hypothetical protein
MIAAHSLSTKRLNYREEDYKQLLRSHIRDIDAIEEIAEANLKRMDALL